MSIPTVAAGSIFDGRGLCVRELHSGSLPAGRHDLIWDGRDELGRDAASAIYTARLVSGSVRESRRVVLLR